MDRKELIGELDARWSLLEGQFTITKWAISDNGVYVIFEPHGPLLEALKAKKRLTSSGGTMYPKWKLRQSMTEEEFLEKRQGNKGAAVPKK